MTSKTRFYTDEHVPAAVVDGLKRRGVDVLTTREAGMSGASDEMQLALATELERVFVTQDTDFLRMHSEGLGHSGIVYAPQQTAVGSFVRGLMLIHQVLTAEEMKNHVEFIA